MEKKCTCEGKLQFYNDSMPSRVVNEYRLPSLDLTLTDNCKNAGSKGRVDWRIERVIYNEKMFVRCLWNSSRCIRMCMPHRSIVCSSRYAILSTMRHSLNDRVGWIVNYPLSYLLSLLYPLTNHLQIYPISYSQAWIVLSFLCTVVSQTLYESQYSSKCDYNVGGWVA